MILPSGASLHPVAAGNHVHRRRRCHTITITDLLTRRDWCTDWSVDGWFGSRSILTLPACTIDSGARLRWSKAEIDIGSFRAIIRTWKTSSVPVQGDTNLTTTATQICGVLFDYPEHAKDSSLDRWRHAVLLQSYRLQHGRERWSDSLPCVHLSDQEAGCIYFLIRTG